jgi:NADPH-dependent curcumin reductase CurA
MRTGETVLVTAAAGGTGQFAVQIAKAAGNRVVATCGGEEKATLLRRLGADRVINYHKEDVKSVLRAEFPKVVPGSNPKLVYNWSLILFFLAGKRSRYSLMACG